MLVDDRAGSQELAEPLSAAGIPTELTRLSFGDLAFAGRDEGTLVGVEYKKLPDLVQSLGSGRLAGHQLPGMVATYDRPYLLIEGGWTVDNRGRVIHKSRVMKGCPPAAVLEQRILTLETRGGLRVIRTVDQKDTIRRVAALYRFFVDRPLEKHTSHLAIHAPDLDQELLIPVSLQRDIAARLPGVGFGRSKAVDRHFDSVLDMINAPVEEWQALEGFGKVLAGRIVGAIRARKRRQ